MQQPSPIPLESQHQAPAAHSRRTSRSPFPKHGMTLKDPSESLKAIGWVSYSLHLLIAVAALVPSLQVSIVVLLVSFILDMVKKDDAKGTWQESHFVWRVNSVIWAFIAYVVTAPLWLLIVIPGWTAWFCISVWFLYRIIKGMVRMHAGQAVS